ncbi:lipopolysaccharide biosynthesis protein [Adlercreutzia sp. ZJ242]|uniref:lipopolysaccharide biosynthesis protein n=1 Tax=Adlercreutzia sp. ZJ242 TaxID=2709409 RepID=UPI0013E9C07B|nr:lipopolysaccharide biosynthesis protein [Adlercreutzia sp. ZJ242]
MQELSIKRNMLWNSAGSLVYLMSQWVVTVLVARLSPTYDAAGVLALAMAVSNIFAHIALYKIRAYQVSDVNRAVSAHEYVAFRLITIGVAFAAVGAYALATCATAAYAPVLLYLAFRAGEVFIDVLHGVDQQNFRMDFCGKSLMMRGILFLAAFAGVFGVTGDLTLAILAMIAVTYPVIVYDVRCAGKLDALRPSITPARAWKLARTCLPAVLGAVFYICVATVPRQYLGAWAGDAALGVYASVCTPAVAVQAGASYLYDPLLGVFAQKFADGDRRGFWGLLGKVTAGIAALFAACFVLFAFAGEPLLVLVFGPSIAAHVYLLYPALVCVVLTAYVSFLSDLLISVRDMRGNLVGNGAGFLVSLPCSVVLVQAFGGNGVSFAVSVAYAVASAIMLAFLARRLKEGPARGDAAA